MAKIIRDLHHPLTALALLHEGELSCIFSPPAPTRLQGLGDALALKDALMALAAAASDAPPQGRLGPVPSPEALTTVTASRPVILRACCTAGFPDPEFVAELTAQLLRRATQRLNSELRHTHSQKVRRRAFGPAVRAAQQFAATLPTLSSGPVGALLDQPAPLTVPGLPRALADDAAQPMRAALPALLRAFAMGLSRLDARVVPKGPGRPETSDALRFGAEGLLAIWRAHHLRPPNLSAKAGGFVAFVEDGLGLIIAANRARGRFGATTPARLARELLEAEREP